MASNEEMYVDGLLISDLRVVDLKEQLEKRGLSKSGSKTVLVKRLKDHLALENMQKAQAGKDPAAAPNMEMRTCGNDFVAEYLEKQQQMLQAAKMAQARSAAISGQSPPASATSSTTGSTPGTPEVDNRLGSPPSSSKRSRSSRTKSPRQSITEPEVGAGATVGLESAAPAASMAVAAMAPTMAALDDQPNIVAPIVQSVIQTETTVTQTVAVSVETPISDTTAPLITSPAGRGEDQPQPEPADSGPAAVKMVETVTVQVTKVVSTEVVNEPPVVSELDMPRGSPSPMKDLEHGEALPSELEGIRDTGVAESVAKGSPSSSGADGDDGSTRQSYNDRGNVDEDSMATSTTASPPATTTIPPDESDEMEMEITAPINAADELFEAVNTAIPTSTSVGGKKLDDDSVESAQGALEKENRDIPQRKRKWVASTAPKRTAVSISSDSLKDIVGSVKDTVTETSDAAADDVEVTPAPKRIVISRDVSMTETSMDADPDIQQTRRVLETEFSRAPAKTTEDGFVRAHSPSPARHPPSNIVHVRGLTRPFTLPQLHELLAKFGSFNKDEFWIDNIKSHCIVKYSDESEAIRARERLHNIHWPITNTKFLRVDFATQEDLDRHRSQDTAPGKLSRQSTENEKERQSVSDRPAREVREIRKSDRDDLDRSAPLRRADLDRDRSWDRGKNWRSGESPPTDPRGAGGRGRSSKSPERKGGGTVGFFTDAVGDQPPQPAKLLDELFRKTKATPCIYWLPLSSEQIRDKERERKKREQERFERVKKMEEEERERRRESYRRHSPVDYRNRRR